MQSLSPLRFDDLLDALRGSGRGALGVPALLRDGFARCIDHVNTSPRRRRSTALWMAAGTLLGALLLGLSSPPLWAWSLFTGWTLVVGAPVWLLQGYVRTLDGVPFDRFLVPNGLTWLRLVLSPLTIWPLLLDDALPKSLRISVLVGLALLDFVDGQIARRCHLESRLGRMLDPTADIALMAWLAVGLYLDGNLPAFAFIAVMVRYPGTILAGILVVTLFGPYEVVSTRLGKVAGALTSMVLSFLAVENVMDTAYLPGALTYGIEIALTSILALNFVYLFYRALQLRPRVHN